jgi:hypothetical protein
MGMMIRGIMGISKGKSRVEGKRQVNHLCPVSFAKAWHYPSHFMRRQLA